MSMKKVFVGVAVIAVLAFGVTARAQETQAQQAKPDQVQPPAQNQEGTLKLTIKYTGSDGPVDQTHKILVFVFDTPDMTTGQVMPIRFESVAENGGTLSMGFTVTPVYVAAIYDKPGGYDFTGPPASGSPVTVYMKDGQAPAPIAIEPGKTIEISMEFDDTIRMP